MNSTLSRLWFIPFSVDLCHCAPPPHPHPILNYNPVFQSTGIWKPLVSQTSRISSTPGSWTSWFKIPRKLIPFSCTPIRHSDLFLGFWLYGSVSTYFQLWWEQTLPFLSGICERTELGIRLDFLFHHLHRTSQPLLPKGQDERMNCLWSL